MANIKEKRKNNGDLAFYFSCCLGRTEDGTQIKCYDKYDICCVDKYDNYHHFINLGIE